MKRYQNGTIKKTKGSKSLYARRIPKGVSAPMRRVVEDAIYRASETKVVCAVASEQSVNTIGAVSVFSVPVPSDGAKGNERIGNKVRCVGIGSKLMFHNNNTSETIWVRAALLEVKNGQMTNSQIQSNLFEGTSDQTVGEAGNQFELIRKLDKEYFTVLRDECIPLGPKAESEGIKFLQYYANLKGKDMKFNDSVAIQPVGTSRYVWIVMAREGDADEGIGSVIECTYSLDFYFKE